MQIILIPLINIFMLIINVFTYLVFIDIILTWLVYLKIINPRNVWVNKIFYGLKGFLDPIYTQIRKMLGSWAYSTGLDLAPVALLLLLGFLNGVLVQIYINLF